MPPGNVGEANPAFFFGRVPGTQNVAWQLEGEFWVIMDVDDVYALEEPPKRSENC